MKQPISSNRNNLLASLLLLIFLVQPASADRSTWEDTFRKGEIAFNSRQQTDCIPIFQTLIDEMLAEKAKGGTLSKREEEMLHQSYDYQAKTYYNDNQPQQAAQAFEKLIRLNPNYIMDENLISPKIIEFFRAIQAKNTGALTLRVNPQDAAVTLDGQPMGKVTGAIYVPTGAHKIEVSKPGYETVAQTVEISAGMRRQLDFQLKSVADATVAALSGNPQLLKSYQTAVASGDSKKIASALDQAGEYLVQQSNFNEAAATYEQAAKLAQESGDFALQGRAFYMLGKIKQEQRDFSGAESRYKQSVEAFAKASNKEGSGNLFLDMGDLALRKSELESARKYYAQALAVFRQTSQTKSEADTLYKIGNIERMLKETTSAGKYYDEALALFQKLQDQQSIASVERSIRELRVNDRLRSNELLNEGSSLRGQGMYKEAEQKFSEALETARRANAKDSMANALLNLGFLATSNGRDMDAKPKYEEALKLAREISNRSLEALALYNLAITYYRFGDRVQADSLYEQSAAAYRELQQNPQPRPW